MEQHLSQFTARVTQACSISATRKYLNSSVHLHSMKNWAVSSAQRPKNTTQLKATDTDTMNDVHLFTALSLKSLPADFLSCYMASAVQMIMSIDEVRRRYIAWE